ncbi:prepilin-type N-terminal cleavage/methylation domain-containing protein [Paenibacillus sp. TRM 82003]|nr:prepilin-type N-terminal cleavage/methylation domain-containing protein [Paenibacillus sp. TRM 82003]
MNRLRNESGLSLIELLAAITISAVVLGTAMLVMGSVNHLFLTSTQRYHDNTDLKRTMRTLSTRIADSNAIVVFDEGAELRFRNGNSATAVLFDETNKTLTMYDFIPANPDDFSNGGISLAANSDAYTNPYELADTVQAVSYSIAEPLVRVTITFEQARVSVRGQRSPEPQEERFTVKLLEDKTTK